MLLSHLEDLGSELESALFNMACGHLENCPVALVTYSKSNPQFTGEGCVLVMSIEHKRRG